MNIQYNYINQLKLYPRQGQGYSDVVKLQKIRNIVLNKQEAAEQAETDASKQLAGDGKSIASKYKAVTDQLKTLAETYDDNSQGLEKYMAKVQMLGGVIQKLQKGVSLLERRNYGLQKAFKINTTQAGFLGEAYDSVAKSTKTGGMNLRKYASELNKIMPLQAKNFANIKTQLREEEINGKKVMVLRRDASAEMSEFSQRTLESTKYLRENLGMSGDAANSFTLFAAAASEGAVSALDIQAQLTGFVPALEETTGLAGTTEAILNEIANSSAATQLQFSKFPGQLGLAALKAKSLGTSLDQIFQVGRKTLDIESSVGAELQYQLVTGKRLVNVEGESLVQKLRTATISGKANDIADAMNEILDTQGDTIRDNLFGRQELAKLMGISEEQLSKMYQQRQLLKDLGPDAEGVLNLATTDFTNALDKFADGSLSEDQLKATRDLMKNQANSLTTDDKILYYIELFVTKLLGDQFKLAGDSKVESAIAASTAIARYQESGLFSDEAAFEKMITDIMAVGGDPDQAISRDQDISRTALLIGTSKEATQAVLATEKAVIEGALDKLPDTVQKVAGFVTGNSRFSKVNDIQVDMTPTVSIGNVGKITGGASPNVQDGIVFNPKDKFMKVNDATMIAGTNQGGNQALAQAITGLQGGSSIDYNKMAAAMVSAMKGVTITAGPDIFGESSMNTAAIG